MNFRSIFLERPYDVRICEAHDFMSAGINASAAMTQTGVTELMNFINNNRNNATNMNIANANNQTAVNIARENNALQRQLLKLQQEYESAEAERARLWNSPVNQVRLMREAGINPATAIAGGSGSMGTSNAMAHAPSSGVSPSMPTLTTPHMEAYRFASPSAAMADIGAAIASLESANKTSKEAELAEKSMNDVLRRIKADADNVEVARDLQLIYGSQKASMEVNVMKADLAVKSEQALNLAKEGKFIEAKTILTRTEERVSKMDYNLKKSQNAILQNDLKTYFTTLNARLDNMRSQSFESRAYGRFTNEQARQLEAMRDYNLTIKANASQMSTAELRKEAATLDRQIEYMLSHFEFLSSADIENLKVLKAQAEQEKFRSDVKWVTYCIDELAKINNEVNKWAPWAFSRESSEQTLYTRDKLPDGSYMDTTTHNTSRSYKPSWKK